MYIRSTHHLGVMPMTANIQMNTDRYAAGYRKR